MKTIYNVKSKQFDNKQATILTVETNAGIFEVFFSYWTPQVVEFPNGKKYNLTFEGSRFAGSTTTSRTTSKQKTAYYGGIRKDFEKMNIKDFEELYFSLNVDKDLLHYN